MLVERRILQMQAAVSQQKGKPAEEQENLSWNKLDCATNWYIQINKSLNLLHLPLSKKWVSAD